MIRKTLISILVAASLLSPTVFSKTRDLRNHNPGGIVKSDIDWKGEVSCSDPDFECFSSYHYGLRAMATILTYYYLRLDYRTVADVLYRWMPPENNPTEAIIKSVMENVCGKMDLNGLTIGGMMRVIILIENGTQPFSNKEIEDAIPFGDSDSVGFYCSRVNPKTMGS